MNLRNELVSTSQMRRALFAIFFAVTGSVMAQAGYSTFGEAFSLGEGVLARNGSRLCPLKCDQDGWAKIDGVSSGPADLWLRMPDGELRLHGRVSITLGRIFPETVSMR